MRPLPDHRLTRPALLWTLGGVSLVAAALHLPRIAALGLSPDGEFSGSTEWELQMARLACLALGIVFVLLAAVSAKADKSDARLAEAVRRDIEVWRNESPPPRAERWNKVWTLLTALYLASMIGVLVWETTFKREAIPTSFRLVTEENGVYETLTAIMLVVSSFLLLQAGNALRKQATHRWWTTIAPLGLGFLFFIAAGEELSWGQHYFGFATPETMEKVNVQKEFNLHNVGGYWANNALILFFFGFSGVLPLAARFFWDVSYLCERLHIPLTTCWLAPIALVSVVFDEREPFVSLFGHPIWRLSELREALFGIVMLTTCGEFWLRFVRRP